MPKEGKTGTLPDGTPVIFLGGQIRKLNPGGLAEIGGGYLESPQGRKYRLGPKGGMDQVAGPTQSQVETYAAKASKVNDAAMSLDALDKRLKQTKNIGPFGWFTNPNDLSEIQGLNKDLLLRLKESPYNLGVLNGPDLSVMEEVTGNPAKLKDAVFRKGYEQRLRNVAATLGRSYRNDAETMKAIGGRPESMPNLFRAPDSTYSADEWGYDGTVPAARYGGSTGARKSATPAKPGAPASLTRERVYNPKTGRVE
jgi:hypothetical protein